MIQKIKFNLDGKVFRSLSNTENGEVDSGTLFYYQQDNDVISANYHGGLIVKGHLVGKQLKTGQLEFVYHHINLEGKLMLGKCFSTPAITTEGKLKYIEKWQWLSGDKSNGESEIIEV
ncbi:MAG: n-acetylglutamate synthase [Proteobacteria bacterium]|nr:n-acetylglutamate synthase [Desulfobulbaceae bacterium]MBU4154450.1 n-acetylglutamate synthase [Pseudomonadota bacterium]